MIRMVHIIACPVDFNLLCDLGQQLGVLKMLLFYIFFNFGSLFVLNMIGRARISLFVFASVLLCFYMS